VRLLHQVQRIEWDVCESETAARHREEQLICVLAPRFNRAGKVWAENR
jgi:excinuclease UvrABC nuclease subunit